MTLDAATRPRAVVLTVSGAMPLDLEKSIEIGRRPRSDYLEMAKAFDATLLDQPGAVRALGRVGVLVERFAGPNLTLAMACFVDRRRHRVVFTDGEQVGLPFAALCWLTRRRPCHIMIGHRLSARKKVIVHRLLRLQRRIDRVVVYASEQRRFAIEHLGYEPERVVLHPFMVDTAFWRPEQVEVTRGSRPLICAAGQELRDYPTLVDAVRGLDVDVVIAAASPWSKREDTAAGLDIPPNVTVRACDHFELRQLYADAVLVVVPLQETDFQAGITTILEAMSMGRALVCTRTTGQTDTIVEGETGRYVPVGDAGALRAAIEALLADPAEAARLGAGGQRWVQTHADVTLYAADLASLVEAASSRMP
jgi:glycosyltransferase involved in cell wall biosynthesis